MTAITSMMIDKAGSESQLSGSRRFFSNLTVAMDVSDLRKAPIDMLHGRLCTYRTDMAVFNGRMENMPKVDATAADGRALTELAADPRIPQIAGTQIKLPCFLDANGILCPALEKPFTHLMKYPGLAHDPCNARGALEWAGMTLARGSGLETASFALAP